MATLGAWWGEEEMKRWAKGDIVGVRESGAEVNLLARGVAIARAQRRETERPGRVRRSAVVCWDQRLGLMHACGVRALPSVGGGRLTVAELRCLVSRLGIWVRGVHSHHAREGHSH